MIPIRLPLNTSSAWPRSLSTEVPPIVISPGRRNQTSQQMQQGRLAGTRRPEDKSVLIFAALHIRKLNRGLSRIRIGEFGCRDHNERAN